MINCMAGGTCNGGNPAGVFEYAYEYGIPDSSCMQYTATNLDENKDDCEPIDICRDCTWPPPPPGKSGIESCWAITNYKKYYVSDYYLLQSVDQMKAEIF